MDSDPIARRLTGQAVTVVSAMHPPSAAHDIIETIGQARIVAVLTIDDPRDAPELASALVGGGLPVIEITLRTPAGFGAIRRVTAEVPSGIVGAGSVTSAEAATNAIDAGARFIVSPGLDPDIIAVAQDGGVPVIPGIATATELLRAVQLGVQVVKLFPAEVVGGVDMIAALSAVWPDVQFMPTGGISPANVRDYLALPQVLAVGGSWMVPRSAVTSHDWASVTAAAVAARQLVADVR